MAYDIASPNTGAVHAAMAPDAVRKLWDRGVEVFEQASDFFRMFEGTSAAFPIHQKTDTSKGNGEEIIFTVMAGLHQRAHYGEQVFENGTHFEKVNIATNKVKVEWFRHAVRHTEADEEKMGMRGQLFAGIPTQLGLWLGRLKTKHMMMMFLHKGADANYRVINGKGTWNNLTAEDTLTYDAIAALGAQMQTKNGKAAYVGKDSVVNPIFLYTTVATSDALFSLDLDPKYLNAKREALSRGPENLIFKGGYANIRGHVIKEYTAIDHDGAGPIGSPFNPKGEVGVEITAGTGALSIQGGGTAENAALTRVDYFEDFPNHAFTFRTDDVLSAGSATHYAIIYNIEGDNAGKWGFYEFTSNNGAALTCTKRLGATGGGIRHPQVGNVVWDAEKNTDAHPEGSIIMLASANAAPIGHTVMLGAAAARRAYGKHQRQRGEAEHEDKFIKDIFIKSVFGQSPRLDARGRAPGFMVLTHAVQYPGFDIDPTLAD